MNRQVFQAFLAEYERLHAVSDAGRQAVDDATEVYAPAPLAPGAAWPGTPRPRALEGIRWDRLVTYPVWFLWTLFIHACLTVLFLGGLGCATALLAGVGLLLDERLGIPLATCSSLGTGALAGLGTLHALYRSFVDQLGRCPW